MDLTAINPCAARRLAHGQRHADPAGRHRRELVVERAGVLNLGVEGMMITGAVTGFIVAVATGSPFLGFRWPPPGAARLWRCCSAC